MDKLASLKRYLSQIISQSIPDHIVDFIASHAHFKAFLAGDLILQEGQTGTCFYGLLSGQVQVEKRDQSNGQAHNINRIDAPSLIGELALLMDQPRLATVVAETDIEVIEFDKAVLDRTTPEGKQAYHYFYQATAERNASRLVTTTEKYTESLSEQLALKNNMLLFGDTFILVLAYLGSWSVCLAMLQYFHLLTWIKSGVGNWVLVMVFLSGALFLMQRLFKHGCSLEDLGVTTRNTWKSVWQSLILLAVLLLSLIIATQFTKLDVWGNVVALWHRKTWYFFNYILHVYLQEFIARGVLLGTLLRFFGEKRYHLAILASAILFTMTHTHKSALFLGLIFSSSVLFGYVYYVQRNLIGVSILHYVTGVVAKALDWL